MRWGEGLLRKSDFLVSPLRAELDFLFFFYLNSLEPLENIEAEEEVVHLINLGFG